MRTTKSIALDIGGSHVSASLIDLKSKGKSFINVIRKDIDAFDTASNILESIGSCVRQLMDEEIPAVIGLAFPGPFNYEKGVAAIANVGGKFDKLFGLNVKEALKDICVPGNSTIYFSNDAHCFSVGAYHRYELSNKNILFLTIGTGIGSAFMQDGHLTNDHPVFRGSGGLFNHVFLDGIADDYFSSRWFLNEFKLRTGKQIASVKELAELNNGVATTIFNDFGSNLGRFLLPRLQECDCDDLVIGGNISRSSFLFLPTLKTQLQAVQKNINIIFCDDTEECILTGAALLAEKENNRKHGESGSIGKRKATQPLLPVSISPGYMPGYDVFPHMHSESQVFKGFDILADRISHQKTVIIDGYGGVLWENFREQLHAVLQEKNISVFWYDIDSCLKSSESINENIKESLNGDDPVFGKKYTGQLIDFFDQQYLEMIQADRSVDLCIVYGTGAVLSNWEGLLVYVDVPKNEIQYRMRAGSITNLGSKSIQSAPQMYKRFYFVDWPVLNKHKEQLLQQTDIIVDEQRINEITWMQGGDFRNTLGEILQFPFRARPWFEAGVWGGHWMKKNIKGLNENEVNYAWSFELITPENGIVIEGNQNLLEVSFDFLLFHDNEKLLGKSATRFGKEFPIRFDFLDTYVGANLSIQCHPRTKYIKENFGENFTQDETYYILDCEPDAKVYLGFQDDIDPDAFKNALFNAQDNEVELPLKNLYRSMTRISMICSLFLMPLYMLPEKTTWYWRSAVRLIFSRSKCTTGYVLILMAIPGLSILNMLLIIWSLIEKGTMFPAILSPNPMY